MNPLKIINTKHVYPPIPDRSQDWCAYYVGEEEVGHYGWGPTEEAAILDLQESYDPIEHEPDTLEEKRRDLEP